MVCTINKFEMMRIDCLNAVSSTKPNELIQCSDKGSVELDNLKMRMQKFTESHERLMKALVYKAHFIRTVFNWFNEFKFGKPNLEDEPRSGRPPTAMTQENIELVRYILREYRKITYQHLEKSVGIGSAAINTIINDHLKYRKLVSRWVPHSLTEYKNLVTKLGFRILIQKQNGNQFFGALSFGKQMVRILLKGIKFDTDDEALQAFINAVNFIPEDEWCKCFDNYFSRITLHSTRGLKPDPEHSDLELAQLDAHVWRSRMNSLRYPFVLTDLMRSFDSLTTYRERITGQVLS
ncbi:hypothetical protein LAZ67_7002789 [Cordylochernes scorpioides]|uniref:Uncharacterized protein n=1 Tax=Cordylochernes scorpioides TaxID=51811 RepID=A0ABY6KTG7_9ARAC|nr:hypothetical protein LAZ67_7002789 [Cordylochernes scorpioides]